MQNTIRIIRERLQGIFSEASRSGETPPRLYDDREVRSLIDLLLEEVCGISRMQRIMYPEMVLPEEQRLRLLEVTRLMQQGIPVQQALGYAWFCDRRFRVSPDVLIPRPETAELVDWIARDCASRESRNEPVRICDIGTGSGCIAISLARLVNLSQVVAVDVSVAALSIAKENAFQQGVDNLQFVHFDILKGDDKDFEQKVIHHLSTTCLPFDIIVSNPPYICRKEAAEMSEIVLDHEPDLALFVPDDDPLLFYRAIADFGQKYLKPGGQLYFEINVAYGPETCQMLKQKCYQQVELRQDINGRDRMVKAVLPL